MSRYIDADKLKIFILTRTISLDTVSDRKFVWELIKKLPSVEVVRCKDCKHGELDEEDFPNQYYCGYDGERWYDADHFCAYGERK